MQTSEQLSQEDSGQQEMDMNAMPPTSETCKLAKEIVKTILKVATDNNISLSGLSHLLEEINMSRIGAYHNPITNAITAILEEHKELSNIWLEAMMMVRLDIRNKVKEENSKTIFGKILNIINI